MEVRQEVDLDGAMDAVGPVDVEDPDGPAADAEDQLAVAADEALDVARPLQRSPTPPDTRLPSARPKLGKSSPSATNISNQMALSAMSKQAYIITVATGGSKGPMGTDGAAGTDANVFISLIGKLAGFRYGSAAPSTLAVTWPVHRS